MSDEQLHQLQARWPATEDYLTRVGQVTNDLMVLRELRAADEWMPSWLDQLGIEADDLLTRPTAASVMKFLWSRQIILATATTVPAYREWLADYEARARNGETTADHLLEEQDFEMAEDEDLRLWALPELGAKLTAWAQEVVDRFSPSPRAVTLTQSAIMLRLIGFMQQDPGMTPEWAAECWRSLFSSGFFAKAGNPTR